MAWNTPDFEDINVCMEVTAYANTDASQSSEMELRRELADDAPTEER